jgi:hypothetical protein
MRTIFTILVVLFIGTAHNLQAQEKGTKPDDRKKIELRPNSREYGAVVRNNQHQRIDRKQNKDFVMKRKKEIGQRRAIQIQQRKAIRQQQIIKRRQLNQQQRRAIRK